MKRTGLMVLCLAEISWNGSDKITKENDTIFCTGNERHTNRRELGGEKHIWSACLFWQSYFDQNKKRLQNLQSARTIFPLNFIFICHTRAESCCWSCWTIYTNHGAYQICGSNLFSSHFLRSLHRTMERNFTPSASSATAWRSYWR